MEYNQYLVDGGDYTLFKANQKLESLTQQGIKPLNLTLGDPVLETFSPLVQRIVSELTENKISQYPSATGTLQYREAVANWAKRNHGLTLNPETNIISANGTKEAVFNFALVFDWTHGQKILQPSLSYPVYASSAKLHGADLVSLPLTAANQFLPDLAAIPSQTLEKCQIFWINSPHNPTTTIMSKDYAKSLLVLAEKYDFFIASDECYNDLYYGEKRPISFLDFPESDRWIVFRSLSKRSHITGFRVGALLSQNQKLMEMLRKLRPHLGVGTPTFIQMGAIEAWNDEAHPKANCQRYKKMRTLIREALENKGFEVFGGESTFYLWFSHPHFQKSSELVEVFIQVGLLLVAGTAFGEDGEGYVRMAYCVTEKICGEIVTRLNQLPSF